MKIYNEDEFDYSTACVGDLVEQKVVDNAMNILPPAHMSAYCAQVGEPYSHIMKDGKWAATFATFKRMTSDVWEYCGHCLRGENKEPQAESILQSCIICPDFLWVDIIGKEKPIMRRRDKRIWKEELLNEETKKPLAEAINSFIDSQAAKEPLPYSHPEYVIVVDGIEYDKRYYSGDKYYPDLLWNSGEYFTANKIREHFTNECSEIAEACEKEGYPSHGTNYELRVSETEEWYRNAYPELFQNDI